MVISSVSPLGLDTFPCIREGLIAAVRLKRGNSKVALYKYPYITGTHGSATNPFVISTPEQWKEFVSYCNSNDTSSTVVILTADLDFSGDSVSPAGTSDKPFKGKIYAQGHRITGAVFAGASNRNSTCYSLFAEVAGADIRDLAITGCTYANPSTVTTNVKVAGIAAYAGSGFTCVNVSVRNDLSVSGVSTNGYVTGLDVAAFCALSPTGNLSFYKCTYQGQLNYTATGTSDGGAQGIFLAQAMNSAGSQTFTVDHCNVDATLNMSGGQAQGGLTGHYCASSIAQTLVINDSFLGLVLGGSANKASANFSTFGYGQNGTVRCENTYVVSNVPLYESFNSVTIKNTRVTQYQNALVSSTVINGNSSTGFTTSTYDTTPGGANEGRSQAFVLLFVTA